MQQLTKKKNIGLDMTTGSIIKKILICSIPFMLTNIIQTLFHSADIFVLGIFVGDEAVAAVGANGSLITLITGLLLGLSVGSNVLTSRYLGEKNREKVRNIIGMSMLLAFISGVIIMAICIPFARTFLIWTKCDSQALDMATKYLIIYLIGAPVVMLYNFCSAIMRSAGDTIRPLLYLIIGGIINVLLNIFFVLVVKLDVEGVAIATIVSELITVILTLRVLIKNDGDCKFEFKRLKIYMQEFKEMLSIGIPSGIQTSLFGIANVTIMSTINSFGLNTMTANAIASQYDGIVFLVGSSISITAVSFVSSNYGAGNLKRVKETIYKSIILLTIMQIILGLIVYALAEPLCYIATDNADVVEKAKVRLLIMCIPYFIDGIMDVFAYSMRGLGRSFTSMLISLVWNCAFRLVFIFLLFTMQPDKQIYLRFIPRLYMVYLIWPITWTLADITYIILYPFLFKKLAKEIKEKQI